VYTLGHSPTAAFAEELQIAQAGSENDVGVGLHIEAPFEDSADLGRGINCKFCFWMSIIKN